MVCCTLRDVVALPPDGQGAVLPSGRQRDGGGGWGQNIGLSQTDLAQILASSQASVFMSVGLSFFFW